MIRCVKHKKAKMARIGAKSSARLRHLTPPWDRLRDFQAEARSIGADPYFYPTFMRAWHYSETAKYGVG